MRNPRDKAAHAISLQFEKEGRCPFGQQVPPSSEPYMEEGGFVISGAELDKWDALTKSAATAAITAFLEAAATIPNKNGRTWRMVPEQATAELRSAGVAWCGNPKTYQAMLADSPEFELDK